MILNYLLDGIKQAVNLPAQNSKQAIGIIPTTENYKARVDSAKQ